MSRRQLTARHLRVRLLRVDRPDKPAAHVARKGRQQWQRRRSSRSGPRQAARMVPAARCAVWSSTRPPKGSPTLSSNRGTGGRPGGLFPCTWSRLRLAESGCAVRARSSTSLTAPRKATWWKASAAAGTPGDGLVYDGGSEAYAAAGGGLIDVGPQPVHRRVIVQDVVPQGETQVSLGDRVHAVDGEIGRVQGFLAGPGDDRVTHVLLQEGHLWGRKEVAIPISAVTEIQDGVRLNITKQQVESLPPVDIDH